MPTHSKDPTFWRDWQRLSSAEQEHFHEARRKFVHDLKTGQGFRKSLRVKGVQGHAGIFEMMWAPDGRATFAYGTSPIAGDVHIIWRRIGSHDIFQNP
jgi:hypothetical protein